MNKNMKSYYLSIKELKKKKFKRIGKSCRISNLAVFIGEKNLSLGNNVRIDDFSIINAFEGHIKIGDNTHISSFCYFLGASGIDIGRDCDIAQGVKLYSKSDDYKSIKKKQIYHKISISKNVIIGSNSVVLPGTTIENDSRIGALTVVSKKVRKNTLYYRNTTKKIK